MIDRERWRPDIGVVAVFANRRRAYMRGRLARCIGTIMAAGAIAGDVHMVEIGRQPGDRRVTVVAVVAARNVRRVFAGCGNAIMTGPAGSEYLSVVNCESGFECRRTMAVLAYVARLYVRRALTDGTRTVVTADAVSDDARMVKNRRKPGRRAVTVVALIARRHVIRGFTGRLAAVMTANTAAGQR